MAGTPRAALSVRAIFLLTMAAVGLYVMAIGGYIIAVLRPAATSVRARTTAMATEYDSLGARSALLRNAVIEVDRLTSRDTLTLADQQRARTLRAELGLVVEQAAGVQANMLLHVSPAVRVALADAAGAESFLAGTLVVALDYLEHGDRALARQEASRADAGREQLIDRLEAAQRLGLESLATSERTLGDQVGRIAAAITVWIAFGLVAIALLLRGAHRRLYLPMESLDAGLARVAEGNFETSLPITRNDEFGRLAAAFNQMTAVLRSQTEVEGLRLSESRFRTLIEQAPVAIFVSRDGAGLYANRAFVAMFGLRQAEDVVGRSLLNYYAPECREERLERAQRFEAGLLPVPDQFESIGLRADDSRFFMQVVNAPTQLPDGPAILSFVTDITESKEAEALLQRLLLDKEALLREVHHRVKNNLQLIASLLHLESARSSEAETKAALAGMHGRLRSIARLHENLTHTESHSAVDLGAYLTGLTSEIVSALVTSPTTIRLRSDLASVHVAMDLAMPCGLLVNELVTNAIKHGFPNGRTGEVWVELHSVGDGRQVRLRVSDDGADLPADILAKQETSLGLQLVSDLVKQLKGTLVIGPPPQAAFTVTFPANNSA